MLCRCRPSMNIHMNMAVRAYSSSTYEASHRMGCNTDHGFLECRFLRECIFIKYLKDFYKLSDSIVWTPINDHTWERWYLFVRVFRLKYGHPNYEHSSYFHEILNKYRDGWSVGRVKFCWSSPAQLFLVPDSAELKIVFFFLTTLGAIQLLLVSQTAAYLYFLFLCPHQCQNICRGNLRITEVPYSNSYYRSLYNY
jgi:hypothetical protein